MFKPVDPKTNFIEMEKNILKWWYESGLVKKYLHKNDSSKKNFSFLDGPITANNPMGVHHAWGRTLKDLFQRFHNAKGEKQRFQNGFDCQGLWVEVEVEKELGLKNKKEIENLVSGNVEDSIAKFVDLCKQRVNKYSQIQTEQSQRLGYFMDWGNSYFTMSDENNYMIWHFLKVCYQKGWIYRGSDSVPWCPRCETAISQHEMLTEDYKEVVHESIYFKLKVVGHQKEKLLVWTTTPWTIPANIAVAVDSKLDYSLIKTVDGDFFWLAKDLVKVVIKDKLKQVIKTVKGKELVGLKYQGPFDQLPAVVKITKENPDKFHLVIATDDQILPITTTEGTGLVHTAVSAGAEDFKLGKKYGLPIIPVIDDQANYLGGFDFLSGKNAKKNPRLILDYLRQNGNWVFKIENYRHRYPTCWRCKTELVWRVADEWYIAMDKPDPTDLKKRTLREEMKDVAKQINWIPDFGLERELDWLSNMHDWLISKPNRYWGLALPIYECFKCGHFIVIGSKEELKKKAFLGWDKFEGHSPHKPWVDKVKIKCEKCGEIINRLPDVGNVWLDAGIIPFSTLIDPKTNQLSFTTDKQFWQEWFPADFITESFPGQFKNWFYSLIAMSTVLTRKPSFKTVLGFATLLDEFGRPMHKSLGNAIEFNEGADKIGVDVMRWLYTSQNPVNNLNFGYHVADEVRRRFHLLLWNIYSFFVTYANLNNFKKSEVGSQELGEKNNILDRWVISRLNQTIKVTTENLNKYDVPVVCQAIEELVNDFSTWYVRRSRERVSQSAESDQDRNECLTIMYETLITIFKLLSPFTPFLAEEGYQNLNQKSKIKNQSEYTVDNSVHLAQWPEYDEKLIDDKLEEQMKLVRKVCELGHAERKAKGIKVRQPLPKFTIYNFPRFAKTTQGKQFTITDELKQLVMDELNVKSIEQKNDKTQLRVEFDTNLTPELIAEGQARELVRNIQKLRKERTFKPTQLIIVTTPSWPKGFEDYIKKKALVKEIVVGKILTIKAV